MVGGREGHFCVPEDSKRRSGSEIVKQRLASELSRPRKISSWPYERAISEEVTGTGDGREGGCLLRPPTVLREDLRRTRQQSVNANHSNISRLRFPIVGFGGCREDPE